jgi:hypothetical protein
MTGNITIFLRGGEYSVRSPFCLDARDSGNNGFNVIYQAYPGEIPAISGGLVITGWQIYDPANSVYRAYCGTSVETRQLYVNGRRAIRARSSLWPTGWTICTAGYIAPDASMSTWRNISDMEIVSLTQWKCFRCGIESIDGRMITMKQPCWKNALLDSYCPISDVAWIENALEFLDEEGEWYLDRNEGFVYYKPREGEDLSTAVVIVPAATSLVVGTGTPESPIHDLEFRGITFCYNTWLEPNSIDGYAAVQAGFRLVGWDYNDPQLPENWMWSKTPAAICFRAAQQVHFERNTFIHLGSAGLTIEFGSQNNTIVGNAFLDISSGAIQVGDIDDFNTSDPHRQNKGNAILNNYIARTGQEFYDSVGIWVGYVADTTIAHNELMDLPYTGISVGWGWGTASYANNNRITNNRIERPMQLLWDGGGIYTLSAQPNSILAGNSIVDSKDIGIYHDQGSAYFTDRNNIVQNAGIYWLSIWTDSIHNNDIQFNWFDTNPLNNCGTNNIVMNNCYVENKMWPPDALATIEAAGLETSFQDIRQ